MMPARAASLTWILHPSRYLFLVIVTVESARNGELKFFYVEV